MEENKKCWGCRSFKAYYTRGYCCLLREKNGFCMQLKKVVEKCDSCDKWRCRYISKSDRAKIALNSIPEIYNKIAVIEQILQEEIEADNLEK